jgi:hypothetical protein
MKKAWLLLFAISLFAGLRSQHYRGLDVLNDQIVWASGSMGTIIRTQDGGQSWLNCSPKGYERCDFRDIEAWDSLNAIAIHSGDSAVVLRTIDGGLSWYLVYASNRPGVFLDALELLGPKRNWAVIAGDPYPLAQPSGDSLWFFDLLVSEDSGWHWQPWVNRDGTPIALARSKTDALFAASGTSMTPLGLGFDRPSVLFAGGGYSAQITIIAAAPELPPTLDQNPQFLENARPEYWVLSSPLPLMHGPAGGCYSLAARRDESGFHFLAVGGDYTRPDERDSTGAYSAGAYDQWKLCEFPPRGYRSCVAFHPLNPNWAVCTGTNGTDISIDSGQNWIPLMDLGYNSCAFSPNALWLFGNRGRFKKISFAELEKLVLGEQ